MIQKIFQKVTYTKLSPTVDQIPRSDFETYRKKINRSINHFGISPNSRNFSKLLDIHSPFHIVNDIEIIRLSS